MVIIAVQSHLISIVSSRGSTIRLIRQSHHVLGIKKLIIVLLLLKDIDFVFLLLARHSSNTFGSAPAACVGSGDLYHASSHDIYQFLMLVSPALAFSTIDYC